MTEHRTETSGNPEDLFLFYLLGGADDEERVQVESLLATQPAAREEMFRLARVTAALGYGAPPVAPSAGVKQTLMARIAADVRQRQSSPPPQPVIRPLSSQQPASPPLPPHPPESGPEVSKPAFEQPAPSPPKRRGLAGLFASLWQPGNPLQTVMAGLTILILVLIGVWGLVIYNEMAWLHEQNTALTAELQAQREVIASLEETVAPVDGLTTPLGDRVEDQGDSIAILQELIEALQAENAALRQDLAEQADFLAGLNEQLGPLSGEETPLAAVQEQLAGQAERLESLTEQVNDLQAENAALRQEMTSQRMVLARVTAPNVQAMSLSGTESLPNAQGQLIANPGDASAVLIVSGLPTLEPGQVYQFWLVEGDSQQGAGIFSVDADGVGTLQITTDSAIGSYDAMGVSVEPLGGSEQPTGEMVMLGNFSS